MITWLVIRPFLPWIIGALALIGGYLWLDRGWCNNACQGERSAKVELVEKIATAQREREAVEAGWSAAAAEAQRRATELQRERDEAFAGLAELAKRDPQLRGVPVPDIAGRVLADAYQRANPPRRTVTVKRAR